MESTTSRTMVVHKALNPAAKPFILSTSIAHAQTETGAKQQR
jgi:hypothetical protein